ncbi:hypothetical protein [Pontibacter sp. H249]|uniref:hypothetical protein n=1 Tax=Pontibacter sp. H249 TaxID=3133420 RepID=UPI0030BF1CE9
MKEDFDFNRVGKRMPYKVPPDFFEQVTQSTLAEAERRGNKHKQPVLFVWRAMAVAASLAILLTVGYFVYTANKAYEPAIATTETGQQQNAPVIVEQPTNEVKEETETAPAKPEEQTLAAITKPEDPSIKPRTNQLTNSKMPETLDDVLATISDEELMLLAAVAETDLHVYEQTFENE